MAVSFVIGRAGSGKTHRCLRAIVEALKQDPLGPPIYWILPRQGTFVAERQLACESGLAGFCRVRVLSFDRLGRDILADAGGAAVPEVDDVGRKMIIGFLLRKNQTRLRFFASVAHQAGLAAKLDATFAELERCGKDVLDLEMLLKEFGASGQDDDQSLRDKVQDLHLIYAAYRDYLGQERLDQHRRLLQVLAAIDKSTLFRDAVVYVDAFLEFTEYERRIIARLGKICRRVEVSLLMDAASPVLREPDLFPDELSLFHAVETAFRRLWFTLKEEAVAVDWPPVVLAQSSRFTTAGLTAIERHLFLRSRAPTAPGDGITLVIAPSRRAEVDAAARHILDLLSQGVRLRDIAVLTRDLEPYHELIDASFREHGIPCFLDRRRATAHHPLVQFLRALMSLADGRWLHEGMMLLLKCGLSGLEAWEADELENYVLCHRIAGAQWAAPEPWIYHRKTTRRSEEAEEDAEAVDTVRVDANRRRVVDKLVPFIQKAHQPGMTVRALVIEIFALFERFEIRQTLTGWIDAATAAGRLEQRGEHEQVWGQTVKLFDAVVDLLGDEQLLLRVFGEVLETGLEQFELALTPPSVDEVLVGHVDRTRIGAVQAVLVLGLDEGAFPRAPREDSVLSDAERRELRKRRLEVDAGADRLLLDESLLGYVAFTRASRMVYASHCSADAAGKMLGPSPFWRRLLTIFPSVEVQVLPLDERDQPACIGTPRQLVTSLMRWVRMGSDSPEPACWPVLYQWLASHPMDGDAVDLMRSRAWKALSYANTASLSPAIAGKIFASPLSGTVGCLEAFASCPFQHFLKFGLNLRPREEGEVSVMDMGSAFHQVLERLVHGMLARREDWANLSDEQREKLIKTYSQEIGKSLRGEILLSSARNRYILQRIEKTLSRVVASQKAAAGRGKFRPAYARLSFGQDGKLPAYQITTPGGREVHLHGSIDRVDLLPGDQGQDKLACSVVDYRMGVRRLALDDVYYGLSLQLLTYLLVLQASGHELAGKRLEPVAAFYVQMIRQLQDVGHPEDAAGPDDPAFHLRVKPRGILDTTYVQQFDSQLAGGSSQVIAARINKDGSFGTKNATDVAAPAEFMALLGHVHRRLGELADGIMQGDVSIVPYMKGQTTPCPSCEFRSVCRFDPALNRYNILSGMSREQVLQRVIEEEKP